MMQRSSLLKKIITGVFVLILKIGLAQQDPQFTHYMYNTMSVNPGYAGQREVLSIIGLYRSQWVGLEGAPSTQTLGLHTPLRNKQIGIGLFVVNDKIGPSDEIYVDANLSYTIQLNKQEIKLSFGAKGGFHNLKTNWSKGKFQNPDVVFNENVNIFSPTIGGGLYLHSPKWYLGLAVPNFVTTSHYKDYRESLAAERFHYFLIGGYVFDIQENIKLKPAFLVKAVAGAPLIADVSVNALLYQKLTLGIAWRWDDSINGLIGFQINKNLFIGYAYDAITTGLRNYSSGSHEIMLRFELTQMSKRLLSPRFF